MNEAWIGRTIGTYRVTAKLGAGGMGEVYPAHDTNLDRSVALKLLPADVTADPNWLRRFRAEARAASSLNHPHILVVHDFGEIEGRPFIVTELVEGETLRERLRTGPLPVGEAVEIAVQVAGALAATHARRLAHRDIKVTSRPSDLQLANHPVLQLRRDLQSRGVCHELTLEYLTASDIQRYLTLEFPAISPR